MRGHIRKDGEKWYAIIDTGVSDTGRRKQKWHGYRTRKEAESALATLIKAVNENTYQEPTKQTVGEYLTTWFDSRTTLKASTRESYGINLRVHIIPAIGHIPLQKLTGQQLDTMYATLLKSGRRDGKGLAPATVRQCHMIIHKALHDAVRKDILQFNVADKADPPTTSQTQASAEMARSFWGEEELRAFLTSQEDDRLYPIWALDIVSGLRRGELLGLRWQDVELTRGSIAVRRSITRAGKVSVESLPKSGKTRQIAIGPDIVKVLQRHSTRQKKERIAWGEGYEDHGLVFCRENGAPLRPDGLSKQFKQRVRKSGLPPLRLHDLRHSAASLLLKQGVNIKVVQERLGHSSSQITSDIYSHLVASLQVEAAQKADAAVLGIR